MAAKFLLWQRNHLLFVQIQAIAAQVLPLQSYGEFYPQPVSYLFMIDYLD